MFRRGVDGHRYSTRRVLLIILTTSCASAQGCRRPLQPHLQCPSVLPIDFSALFAANMNEDRSRSGSVDSRALGALTDGERIYSPRA